MLFRSINTPPIPASTSASAPLPLPLPHSHIFTIDPQNTTTYDDALELSYRVIDPIHPPTIAIISVHISDVVAVVEQLHLWDKLAENIRIPASIYMPDKRHSILPTHLERECSLVKNTTKRVITIAFHIDLSTNTIIHTDVRPTTIVVKQNYVYDSNELFRDSQYKTLYDITRNLAENTGGAEVEAVETDVFVPQNSTEIVEFWMLKTNTYLATVLKSHHSGIFRIVKEAGPAPPLHKQCDRPQQEWNLYHRGKYQLYDPEIDLTHDALKIPQYIHITSPIRRLVDILNQIILYETLRLHSSPLSADSLLFLEKWRNESEIEMINTQMQTIQKLQTECELLTYFTVNPAALQTKYKGVVVDQRNAKGQYTIYLYDIRLFCPVKIHIHTHLVMGQEYGFNVFLFKDENTFHKKIRVGFVENESGK